jgi:dihydrofolate synthase/folylpolyglutamate synthase
MNKVPDAAYLNVIDQVYNVGWVSRRLARIERLRRFIKSHWPDGHPTKCIHVVGTSGKGSVSKFLERGLNLVHRSGALTSPHLMDFAERFSVAGTTLSHQSLVGAWERIVLPYCVSDTLDGGGNYTFFESCLMLALILFDQSGAEYAAVEAGIGGRYDDTAAIDPVAVVLTNVGDDHQDRLGTERWQRLLDKIGVCRLGVPLFTNELDGELSAFCEAWCEHVGSPVYRVSGEYRDLDAIIDQEATPDLHVTLSQGEHQKANASLAFRVIRHIAPDLPEARIWGALANVEWKGGLFTISMDPPIYADVAHNIQKFQALAQELQSRFAGKLFTFVLGLSKKRESAILTPILFLASEIIVTGASFSGVEPLALEDDIRSLCKSFNRDVLITRVDHPKHALEMVRGRTDSARITVVTGSAYMIEQALNSDPYLQHLNRWAAWRGKKDE